MSEPFQSPELQNAINIAEGIIGDRSTALRVVKSLVAPFWNTPWDTWSDAYHEVVKHRQE